MQIDFLVVFLKIKLCEIKNKQKNDTSQKKNYLENFSNYDIKKFVKPKVYSSYKVNIWGADLAG